MQCKNCFTVFFLCKYVANGSKDKYIGHKGEMFMEVLSLKNIFMNYQTLKNEVAALDDINFDVSEGEFVVIIGPSGCGKSTLLSIISGILKPSNGAVYLDGEKSCGITSKIGYMLQNDNLLEWRTIYKNVLLGLEIQKQLTEENIAYADTLLKTYGLYEFKDSYPSQLSGGMRQRVALIRTLVTKPEILLLDEACSALDYQTRLAVTDDVYSIIKKEKKTVVMVTHDIPEGISMADRVIVLSTRPARIQSIHDITFETLENRTPLLCRKDPKFSQYFDLLWKEIDMHEK